MLVLDCSPSGIQQVKVRVSYLARRRVTRADGAGYLGKEEAPFDLEIASSSKPDSGVSPTTRLYITGCSAETPREEDDDART